MATVDLTALTKNKVAMLTGHERGLQARIFFALDDLEEKQETLQVVAPANLDTITPSFVQGLLAGSVRRFGVEKLAKKYDFSLLPEALRQDFKMGIERLAIHARRLAAIN
jgi:hypothetical protein